MYFNTKKKKRFEYYGSGKGDSEISAHLGGLPGEGDI